MFENENDQTSTLSGEEDLFAALQSLKLENDDDDNEVDVVENNEDELDNNKDEEEIDTNVQEEDEEDEQEEDLQEEPTKKKQSKEENAKFAAERRQKELEKKVQEKLSSSPEFALAQKLSDMYGKPVDEIMKDIQEAQLQKEATERNLPIELLRERNEDKARIQSVEDELNQLKFQAWEARIQTESQTLKGKYTMLTDDDIEESVQFLLNTVGNVNMPLSQAVYALHGEKIIESKANAKAQDNLASQSGRKTKTPLPPNNGKQKVQGSLTSDELRFAKMLGISESDYLKNK